MKVSGNRISPSSNDKTFVLCKTLSALLHQFLILITEKCQFHFLLTTDTSISSLSSPSCKIHICPLIYLIHYNRCSLIFIFHTRTEVPAHLRKHPTTTPWYEATSSGMMYKHNTKISRILSQINHYFIKKTKL